MYVRAGNLQAYRDGSLGVVGVPEGFTPGVWIGVPLVTGAVMGAIYAAVTKEPVASRAVVGAGIGLVAAVALSGYLALVMPARTLVAM